MLHLQPCLCRSGIGMNAQGELGEPDTEYLSAALQSIKGLYWVMFGVKHILSFLVHVCAAPCPPRADEFIRVEAGTQALRAALRRRMLPGRRLMCNMY